MIGPGGRGEVDWLRSWARVEAGKEESSQMNGTRARDSLERFHLEEANDIRCGLGCQRLKSWV